VLKIAIFRTMGVLKTKRSLLFPGPGTADKSTHICAKMPQLRIIKEIAKMQE